MDMESEMRKARSKREVGVLRWNHKCQFYFQAHSLYGDYFPEMVIYFHMDFPMLYEHIDVKCTHGEQAKIEVAWEELIKH